MASAEMQPIKPVSGYEEQLAKLSLSENEAKPSSHGFLLPPARSLCSDVSSATQGWKCDTVVKESNVKVAGNGRYAVGTTEGETLLNEGDVVVEKKLIPMKTIETMLNLPNDGIVIFANEDDLEKYVSLAEKEGNYTRAQVLKVFEHFVYSMDGQTCCLNVCTWTVNHADEESEKRNPKTKLNCVIQEAKAADGLVYYRGMATTAITSGEEIHIDYRRFATPPFYHKYSDKHEFVDVRKATLTAVYGGDDEKHCGKSLIAWQSL